MPRPSIILVLWGMICTTGLSGQSSPATSRPLVAPFDTVLFTAIRSGDLVPLEKCLASGSDPNATQYGYSALMVATLAGTPQQMKLLLDHGAKPNYADADSLTALWYAIPDSAKTFLLLDHGADPNLRSKENYAPLIKLVNCPGTTGLFQALVARGADPKRAADDNALLYWAASTDDTTLLGMLLRLGFRANDTVSFGDYPINSALLYRCSHTLKMLVDHGADVNVVLPPINLPNLHGMTALMQAAVADDEFSFFYLLDHGANVNAKCAKGYTALMFLQLAETDHPAMTKALLEHGAIATVKDPNGDDAVTLAEKKGNTESLRMLKRR